MSDEDEELKAMGAVLKALGDLEVEAQRRVMAWISDKLKIGTTKALPTASSPSSSGGGSNASTPLGGYGSLGELISAAKPKTDAERALLAAVFLSKNRQQSSLTGYEINLELKNTGYPIGNITDAIDRLMSRQPSLMAQLQKSGKTKQARKTYKVTEAGFQHVSALLHGGGGSPDSGE